MTWFRLFANACSALVLVMCFFTKEHYAERVIDMIFIAINIFVVLNKLDSIEEKLNS